MSNAADALKHVWFHATSSQSLKSEYGMTVFNKGEDCYLIDEAGNRYLDALSGGAFVTNVGHGRAEIADAMAAQAKELAYVAPYSFVAPTTVKLAKVVADLTPGDLNRIFFTSGGSESVETAMKIAKQYHYLGGDQKRTKVISRRGSYHGSTQYAMSISGASHDFNNKIFGPLVPGCLHVPHNNCYRCEFGLSQPGCKLLCADMIERQILHEGPETVAAIIAEPVPAAASIYPAPDEYLPMLREIADKYGVLLIIDEVINGFGRTGSMFAVEQWGIVPDLMTMAKGLTSGYSPMGAVAASDKVVGRFEAANGREAGLNHVLSFGGHAVSAAAALANIDILTRENLVENSREMGKYLMDGLDTLRSLPIVGDVRGRGLLCAVELVRDKKTREPFGPADQMSVRMTNYLREEGILARTYQVVEFGPPLTAGKAEVETIVTGMERAIRRFMKDVGIS